MFLTLLINFFLEVNSSFKTLWSCIWNSYYLSLVNSPSLHCRSAKRSSMPMPGIFIPHMGGAHMDIFAFSWPKLPTQTAPTLHSISSLSTRQCTCTHTQPMPEASKLPRLFIYSTSKLINTTTSSTSKLSWNNRSSQLSNPDFAFRCADVLLPESFANISKTPTDNRLHLIILSKVAVSYLGIGTLLIPSRISGHGSVSASVKPLLPWLKPSSTVPPYIRWLTLLS